MFTKVKALTLLTAMAVLVGCVDANTQANADKPQAVARNVDPETGIAKNALVAVAGIPDLGGTQLFGIFYKASKADGAQLKAAPGKLCASRGLSLISAEDAALEHPEQMPGVRKLMVRCK